MGGSSSVLGSILNGIGTDRIAGGDPVKGAMINASMLAGSGGLNAGANIGQSAIPSAQQAAPSIFDKGINFIQQNPNTSLNVAKMAVDAFTPEQQQAQAAAPISYGNNQSQYVDFASLLNPQKNTVIRPQNISLLG